MKLTREPGGSAEDVFLVGEELVEDGVERLAPSEPEASLEEASIEAPRGEGEPGFRERTPARGRRARLVGVVGLVLGGAAVVAIVASRGSDEPGDPSPVARPSISARPPEQRATDAQPVAAADEGSRRQAGGEQRGKRGEASEEKTKREPVRKDAAQAGAAEAAPPPASPAPEPVESATAPVTTTAAPAPAAPAPAPEQPAASADGDGSVGGSSCGPYDIGC